MDKFAPEFARFWLPADEGQRVSPEPRHDDDERVEQKALEDLADLVSAARSIV